MTEGAVRVRAPGEVTPMPAMVWIDVAGAGAAVSCRMRWLLVSAGGRRAAGERAVLRGESSEAAAAGALSPAKVWVPSPAIVVMMPVVASMRRMRWLAVSAR